MQIKLFLCDMFGYLSFFLVDSKACHYNKAILLLIVNELISDFKENYVFCPTLAMKYKKKDQYNRLHMYLTRSVATSELYLKMK